MGVRVGARIARGVQGLGLGPRFEAFVSASASVGLDGIGLGCRCQGVRTSSASDSWGSEWVAVGDCLGNVIWKRKGCRLVLSGGARVKTGQRLRNMRNGWYLSILRFLRISHKVSQ